MFDICCLTFDRYIEIFQSKRMDYYSAIVGQLQAQVCAQISFMNPYYRYSNFELLSCDVLHGTSFAFHTLASVFFFADADAAAVRVVCSTVTPLDDAFRVDRTVLQRRSTLFFFFSILFIIFTVLFSLPPINCRYSGQPLGHICSRLGSLSSHYGPCLSFFIARRL